MSRLTRSRLAIALATVAALGTLAQPVLGVVAHGPVPAHALPAAGGDEEAIAA